MAEEEAESVKQESINKPLLPTKRNSLLIKLTIGIIFIGMAWFLYWMLYLKYYEYTDDAYASGNMININPSISGSVIDFYVDDTDFVVEGQLLVRLDPTLLEITYQKELSTLASVVLDVKQLYDHIEVAKAIRQSKRIARDKAKYDFENRSRLIGAKAVSNEDFTHARDNLQIAEAELKQAEAQLNEVIDAVGNTPLKEHPLINKQKEIVRTAYYNLEHCSIYAPASGYVAQRVVEVGQWVTAMSNLMAIIPTDHVWVEANFKETQLTYMRIGQPADIWFDFYGSHVKFTGKVVGIASGTGSIFSIIPPQNATGNWIKIVQRLPVRIGIDAQQMRKYPIRLGISAEVNVDISDQNLPMLASKAPQKSIAKTSIYNINFNKADELIDQIIKENTTKKVSLGDEASSF